MTVDFVWPAGPAHDDLIQSRHGVDASEQLQSACTGQGLASSITVILCASISVTWQHCPTWRHNKTLQISARHQNGLLQELANPS